MVFEHVNQAELDELRFHGSDTIAIRSNWELLIRESEDVGGRNGFREASVQRFVGFLEGRLRFKLPEFLLRLKPYSNGTDVVFDLSNFEEVLRLDMDSLVQVPVETDISVDRKSCEVMVGSKFRFVYDKKKVGVFSRLDYLEVSDNCCFVRFFDDFSLRQEMICYSPKEKKILWSQEVWCGGEKFNFYSGLGKHLSEMLIVDGKMFVIGVTCDCVYIEGFSVNDGHVLLRFSSSY